jgi:hypothetical protein
MPWGVVAGAVIGGIASNMAANKQSSATNNAANAQLQATQDSIAEQRREYDQARTDQLPFLQAGYGALGRENAFLNGDTSGFDKSPDYLFSLNQGIGALDKSAAANGSLYSGGHSADLMQFAEGTANQFANNYWNKLASMAGQGQVTAGNLGNLGANMANNISNLNMMGGNARASSFLRNGDIQSQQIGAWGNAINQGLGYFMNRPQTVGTSGYIPQSFSDNYGSGSVANYYNNPGVNTGTYDVFGLGGG